LKNDQENEDLLKRVAVLEKWREEWIDKTQKRDVLVDKTF
jgi:hypothetical protein